MSHTIQKLIDLKAPVSRVWEAITDSKQFGEWFRVKMDDPFIVGESASGYLAVPGYEHLKLTIKVESMEKEKLFSFHWHPHAIDPKVDYSKETPTLVEFKFEIIPTGTRLILTESGFENIPAERRFDALRSNDAGWTAQMKNIEKYLG